MPPHNSPNDTRPSTPPPSASATASALSSHPYLQQLEAAISTPVPDLASTLGTPESHHWRPTTRPPRRASTISRLQERAERLWQQVRADRDGGVVADDDEDDDADDDGNDHIGGYDDDDEVEEVVEEYRQLQQQALHSTLSLGSPHDFPVSDTAVVDANTSNTSTTVNIANIATTLPDLPPLPSLDLTFPPSDLASVSASASADLEVERWRSERDTLREILASQSGRDGWEPRRRPSERTRERERSQSSMMTMMTAAAAAAAVTTNTTNTTNTTSTYEHRLEPRDQSVAASTTTATTTTAAAAAGGEIDTHPRRELERALRNYRMARSTFRSGRHGSAAATSDIGPVPTASALRAYWSEESDEREREREREREGERERERERRRIDADWTARTLSLAAPSQSHLFQSRFQATNTSDTLDSTPFALSDFVEQHRLERQRRHLENIRRRSEQRARFEGQYENQRFGRRSSSSISSISNVTATRCPAADGGGGLDNGPFVRVRNTIRYLSQLRGRSVQGALDLAHELGLDTLYDSCSDAVIASDLPLSVDALPRPAKSSWLQPGMTWHGLQSTDREPTRSASTLLSSALRRIRPRDYMGRAMARRGYTNDPWTRDGYRSMAPIPVEAADRYLLHMMGDEGALAELASSSMDAYPLIPSERSTTTGADAGDHWPVTVVLHEVDWGSMTVKGTMRACQIPDKTNPAEAQDEGKSMESFFEGEIIDFDNNTLLSDGARFEYKVGGVDVDARYWARLGPFKREIDKEAALLGGSVAKTWDEKSKYHNWLEKNDPVLSSEQRQRRETAAEEAMARALGSERWLREKLANEWVLMRWKEKCFVDPIMLPSDTKSTRSTPTSSNYPSTSTTLLGDRAQAQWGLTISGFYYIALHRQSGRIDGLYYDPGSQPYQSLRMAPEGCQLRDEIEEASSSVGLTGTSTGSAKELEGIGLKKWFPALDFR